MRFAQQVEFARSVFDDRRKLNSSVTIAPSPLMHDGGRRLPSRSDFVCHGNGVERLAEVGDEVFHILNAH